MSRQMVSAYRRLAGASVAVASIVSLAACSQAPSGSTGGTGAGAPGAGATSAASALPSELPAKFASWTPQSTQITACAFDPVTKSPDGTTKISGWGIIEAATGVAPEAFILKIDKDGSEYYQTTQPQERKDLVAKFGKPTLARGGFQATLSASEVKPPFTATMILAFDKRLFNCEYKVQV